MAERNRKRERGQSLVEIAISFPILLIILSGLLDIGRVYFTYIALEDAAREGALYLALNPLCEEDTTPGSFDGDGCDNPNNAYYRVCRLMQEQLLLADEITDCTDKDEQDRDMISIDVPTPVESGDIVRLTVRYDFRFATPGISAIARAIELEVTATDIVLTE